MRFKVLVSGFIIIGTIGLAASVPVFFPGVYDLRVVLRYFGLQTDIVFAQGRVVKLAYPGEPPVNSVKQWRQAYAGDNPYLLDGFKALEGLAATQLVHGCTLSRISPAIKHLTALEELRLTCPQLALPHELGQLQSLKRLYIRTIYIPPEIGRLTKLELLSVRESNLGRLPAEIGNLQALKELVLLNNQLTVLPPELCRLTSLRSLSIQDKVDFPCPIDQLSQLEELGLYGTGVPPGVWRLENLRYLSITGRHVSGISSEIGALTKLKRLLISNTSVLTLPVEMGYLTELQVLDLRDNYLVDLPPTIEKLSLLTHIYLDRNNLVQVPPAIPRLPHLKRLNLSFNCLREDPAYLASLSTDLVLAGNRFNDMTRDCTAYLRVREGDGAGY